MRVLLSISTFVRDLKHFLNEHKVLSIDMDDIQNIINVQIGEDMIFNLLNCQRSVLIISINYLKKMSQELKDDIEDLCEFINQKCEIDRQKFNFDLLQCEEWYLEILSILCPYLEDQLNKIYSLKNSQAAIKEILQLINSLDQFNEDVTQIVDPTEVVHGNLDHISYMVQIFHTLLEAAIKEQQDGNSEADQQEKLQHGGNSYSHSAFKQEQKPQENYMRERSSSEGKRSKSHSGRHSVLGINNEFEKEQNEESDQFQPNNAKKQIFSPFLNSNEKTPFQNVEKAQQQNQFYSENKKQSSNQPSDQPYLNQKLNKSEKKKTYATTTHKKNPEKDPLIYGNKKVKKLVIHPQKKSDLKKVKSEDNIKLTKQVIKKVRNTQVKQKKMNNIGRAKSPTNEEMRKKKKEMNYFYDDFKKMQKQNTVTKNRKRNFEAKNEYNLKKILNWREEKMKKEKKQYEASMKARIESKKETYIRKVNDLVLRLEKEKQIQQRKQFKENLLRENQQAVKRMTSLQKWYRDKLDLLKQNKKGKRNQHKLIQTGHKQIVNQIEKQLKKDNEKKLLALTHEFREEEANIDHDLSELENKIIKIYKKN